MSSPTTLDTLIDHHDVSQVLYRYGSAVDEKDFSTLRSLFVDDAVGQYGPDNRIEGADAIVAWIVTATESRSWQHHLLSVYHVDVVGDEATALTYHTSHQTVTGEPDAVRVIVARYHDRLRRVDGGWKIAHKEFEIGWREVRPKA